MKDSDLYLTACVMPKGGNPLLWRFPLSEVFLRFKKEEPGLTKAQFLKVVKRVGLPLSRDDQGVVTTEAWWLEEWVTPKMLG